MPINILYLIYLKAGRLIFSFIDTHANSGKLSHDDGRHQTHMVATRHICCSRRAISGINKASSAVFNLTSAFSIFG